MPIPTRKKALHQNLPLIKVHILLEQLFAGKGRTAIMFVYQLMFTVKLTPSPLVKELPMDKVLMKFGGLRAVYLNTVGKRERRYNVMADASVRRRMVKY